MELSKRKSASDCIRTLILFGFVYDVDYSYLRQYNETLGKISGNLNQIEKRKYEMNSTVNVDKEAEAEIDQMVNDARKKLNFHSILGKNKKDAESKKK